MIEAFDESPRHAFTESPRHARVGSSRIPTPLSDAPVFAAAQGVCFRYGYSDFDSTAIAYLATGATAQALSGCARWGASADVYSAPGSVVPGGVGSGVEAFYAGLADGRAINRYLKAVGYHEITEIMSVDPTTGRYTTAQCWVRATASYNRLNGCCYDLLLEWSSYANPGGSPIPAGSAHYTCDDSGILSVVGAFSNYNSAGVAMGFIDWFATNMTVGGAATNVYSANVTLSTATATVTGTQDYQLNDSSWTTYGISETWSLNLFNPHTASEASDTAMGLMDSVGGFGSYALYDPGTATFTNTLFGWGSQWSSYYLPSFPVLAVTVNGGLDGSGSGPSWVLRIQKDAYWSMHAQKIWVYSPYPRLLAPSPARVCFSAAEQLLATPNSAPAGSPDNGSGPTPSGAIHGTRFDNMTYFQVGPGSLHFPYGSGNCAFESVVGGVSSFPGAGCPLITSHDTAATPPEDDTHSAGNDTRSAENSI